MRMHVALEQTCPSRGRNQVLATTAVVVAGKITCNYLGPLPRKIDRDLPLGVGVNQRRRQSAKDLWQREADGKKIVNE